MSPNKETVEKFKELFSKGDRQGLSSLLTDDVEWVEWAEGFPGSGVPKKREDSFHPEY